jgi:preprotein translocase subunit SecE
MLQFVKDVRQEWFKIVWPNRDDVVRSTILVIVFSALFAAFLFLADSVMTALVGWIF